MKLIFELGTDGQGTDLLPECDVPKADPGPFARSSAVRLPQVSEVELSRHYAALARRAHGVSDGFYPLGSCTMKYSPKINEELASMREFTGIHPLQPEDSVQGCLEVLARCETMLCEITGMDSMSFQPAAGAHGEFTGLLLIRAYHKSRGDEQRRKIIVPDSAHGTNPASAAMAGYEVVNLPSGPDGCVDLDALKQAADEKTAGLMLTNPNTVGLFDRNILDITKIIHDAGGLCYYDGANMNAIMGIARPGDMGFDIVHLNLHKTFSTPHGGGGPGSGPVGCKASLSRFLPGFLPNPCGSRYSLKRPPNSIGDVKAFYGNFLVVLKAYAYLLELGKEGIPEAARNAVLNANYMMSLLKAHFQAAYDRPCMHEFVITLEQEKKTSGISAADIAKALLDHGIHPPTMYFPLIVQEALMIEPTETEPRETLEEAAKVMNQILDEAQKEPSTIHLQPLHTPVRRLDEVAAARRPIVCYEYPQE